MATSLGERQPKQKTLTSIHMLTICWATTALPYIFMAWYICSKKATFISVVGMANWRLDSSKFVLSAFNAVIYEKET